MTPEALQVCETKKVVKYLSNPFAKQNQSHCNYVIIVPKFTASWHS